MSEDLVVVLDVGKTVAKLTLWRTGGSLVARRTRHNDRVDVGDYVALDTVGIEAWLADTLADFGKLGRISAIVPVAHGAACAIVRDGALVCPPMDYETPLPAAELAEYATARDEFSLTGSPALPDGLNLGAQLYYLEQLCPDLLAGNAFILLWPQYWAWTLSGVAASEVTSLGCHSDLWRPLTGEPSALASVRGWASRLPQLRHAGNVIGTITADWAARTGLRRDVQVYCGLHDSNAALLAARGFTEFASNESTVLSTGTWFVAMRSPAKAAAIDTLNLPESRDCLVNVDVNGNPIPSSRFMGGREIERLTGIDMRRIDTKSDQPAILDAVPRVLASGTLVLPTFAPGFGPVPHGSGRWIDKPADETEKRAAIGLYAALVADISLDLIGTKERILVEGRFADAEVFVRALASLRTDCSVYASSANNGVAYGALRIIDSTVATPCAITKVAPLDLDLTQCRSRWRHSIERPEMALLHNPERV